MNVWAIAGLIVMVLTEAATLAGLEPFASWNTPIAWTGFILFADSLVWQARGRSWLRSSPGEFAFLAIVSIPLWLVFEFFNLYLDNWYYVGLPEHAALRLFGYAWSFATIWPAIFEAADLIGVWRARGKGSGGFSGARGPQSAKERPWRASAESNAENPPDPIWRPLPALLSIAVGALMLAAPFLVPRSVARYLAAPVWLGFIFLVDPINHRMGGESLAGDLHEGQYDRLKNLILSGFLCGILWEFWNYWARAKWHYTVPIMENLKVFEMPVPGYLGFPAFALECFTMYVFTRALFARLVPWPGRTIGVPIGGESPLRIHHVDGP